VLVPGYRKPQPVFRQKQPLPNSNGGQRRYSASFALLPHHWGKITAAASVKISAGAFYPK
jgi:hypothetical protein